jgi:hypothetical protein
MHLYVLLASHLAKHIISTSLRVLCVTQRSPLTVLKAVHEFTRRPITVVAPFYAVHELLVVHRPISHSLNRILQAALTKSNAKLDMISPSGH